MDTKNAIDKLTDEELLAELDVIESKEVVVGNSFHAFRFKPSIGVDFEEEPSS
jgi:hypothetical protein